MLILKAKSWVISLTNNTLFLGDQSRCVFTTLLRKTPSEIRESWVVVLLGAKVAALPRRSGSSILDISTRVGGEDGEEEGKLTSTQQIARSMPPTTCLFKLVMLGSEAMHQLCTAAKTKT